MEEIKFRAWDRVRKNFVTGSLKQGAAFLFSAGNHIRENMEPWELFTGLVDKNGKEIFDGDFVKNGLGSNYLIKKCVGGFECVDDGFVHNFSVLNESVEITGNIHQNPELLLDKKPE